MSEYDPRADDQGVRDQELERLRELLLGPEREQLRRVVERLDRHDLRARETGEVLPEAVVHSLGEGPGLEQALAPSLGRVTREAVRRDAKAFADALFPVMGPAIRRAIAEALRGLVQALNQALEHSLSLRGLGWRLEAMRTGRSFGEVVLAKTLVYRVEQVYLVHRESGLLLQHVVASGVTSQDADMVSGMLTAIRDFARDSFRVGEEEGLETMEVGELQVWVEQGPHAILAAVVRGNPPVELRQALREALEGVHLELAGELGRFTGDAAVFGRARPLLEDCLRSQAVARTRRRLTRVWLLGLLLLALVAGWLGARAVSAWRFERLLEALRAEPGVVVTGVVPDAGARVVVGLKDPLASPPEQLLGAHGLDPRRVRFRLQGYYSLEPPMVLARAQRALQPPPTVSLELEDGVLTATGAAEADWVTRARAAAERVVGVTRYDDSALQRELEGALRALVGRVESHQVRFALSSDLVEPAARAELAAVGRSVVELVRAATADGRTVRVRVAGHADPTGTVELNRRLSRGRAQAVVDALVERGVPPEVLEPVGVGPVSGVALADEDPAMLLEELRKVSFTVEVGPPGRPSTADGE